MKSSIAFFKKFITVFVLTYVFLYCNSIQFITSFIFNALWKKVIPIFANIVLADEINRTPPKTQAALLEAMQEKQATIGKETFEMDLPFFVLATQNPIETLGVYTLPEAQIDRFLFKIIVGYTNKEEEIEIIKRAAGLGIETLHKVFNKQDIERMSNLVEQVYCSDNSTDSFLQKTNCAFRY